MQEPGGALSDCWLLSVTSRPARSRERPLAAGSNLVLTLSQPTDRDCSGDVSAKFARPGTDIPWRRCGGSRIDAVFNSPSLRPLNQVMFRPSSPPALQTS